MPRCLIAVFCALFATTLSSAALLPDGFEGAKRLSAKKAPVPNQELWNEYGFKDQRTEISNQYNRPGIVIASDSKRIAASATDKVNF